MAQLGGGWTEHFTTDGKPYYHHAATQQTTWNRPNLEEQKAPPSVPSNPPDIKPKPKPAMKKAETSPPGDLLAAIRKPPPLKKTEVRESSGVAGRVVDGTSSSSRASIETSSPPAAKFTSGGGGLMNELTSAMNRRSSTGGRLTGSKVFAGAATVTTTAPAQHPFQLKARSSDLDRSNGSSSTPSVTSSAPPPIPSQLPTFPAKTPPFNVKPSHPNVTFNPNDVQNGDAHSYPRSPSSMVPRNSSVAKPVLTVEQRLDAIEEKMDKILKHFGIA